MLERVLVGFDRLLCECGDFLMLHEEVFYRISTFTLYAIPIGLLFLMGHSIVVYVVEEWQEPDSLLRTTVLFLGYLGALILDWSIKQMKRVNPVRVFRILRGKYRRLRMRRKRRKKECVM